MGIQSKLKSFFDRFLSESSENKTGEEVEDSIRREDLEKTLTKEYITTIARIRARKENCEFVVYPYHKGGYMHSKRKDFKGNLFDEDVLLVVPPDLNVEIVNK